MWALKRSRGGSLNGVEFQPHTYHAIWTTLVTEIERKSDVLETIRAAVIGSDIMENEDFENPDAYGKFDLDSEPEEMS